MHIDAAVWQSACPQQGISMKNDEGRELMEYALIAAAATLGVAVVMSSIGPYVHSIWRTITLLIVE